MNDFADKLISLCTDGEFMRKLNTYPATIILELAEELKEEQKDTELDR